MASSALCRALFTLNFVDRSHRLEKTTAMIENLGFAPLNVGSFNFGTYHKAYDSSSLESLNVKIAARNSSFLLLTSV